MMGLKRFFPAMTKASSREIPLALLLFTESTRRESFTTTPESATIPMIEIKLSSEAEQ